VLKKLELFGAVRGYYFKEKQNFGIVQFVDPSVVDAVIENFKTDDLGFNVTVERTAKAKDHTASPHSFGSIPASLPSQIPSTPPPEKPDTILVLKNLPFTLKQDQLHEILLSLSTTIPQSISLHYDNAGVFRGMAFIKYRQLEDAIQVYELLNGMDVGGRKVRVEYKRKAANATTPRGTPAVPVDIPAEWQEDEELRKLWEQLAHFKEDATQSEWYYPSNLSNNQKRNIYNMCEKLKLYQGSSGDSEVRVQYLTKKPQEHHVGSVDSKRGVDIKARRTRHDSDAGARVSSSPNNSDLRSGRNSSVGRNDSKHVASSAPADMHLDWRHNQHQPAQSNQQPLVAPVRQPRGPDGSKGFADQYRTSRKLNLLTTCAFLAAPATEVVA
jgi:RNA recognition motif-containing protein